MLFSSALISLPPSFELLRLTIDNQNATVGLSSTCYHVSDKISVAGCIKNCKISVLCSKEFGCYIDGNSSLLFFFGFVHDVGELEACFAKLLCFLLVLAQCLVRNLTQLKQ